MKLRCKKIRLHAYLDGELPAGQAQAVEAHLKGCPVCAGRLEEIRQVGTLLHGQDVPLLPPGFTTRLMTEARRRMPDGPDKIADIDRNRRPFPWFSGMPVPMRLAAGVIIVIACILGTTMSREISLSGRSRILISQTEALNEFEWFGPTPPSSLGAAYLALASGRHQDQGEGVRVRP